MEIAVQMYSMRFYIEKHGLDNTLKVIADSGCTTVELAGTYGLSYEELHKKLEQYGLRVCSAHISADCFDNFGEVSRMCETLDFSTTIVPSMPEEFFNEKFDELITRLGNLQQKAAAASLTLGYHNHHFEFIGGDKLSNLPRSIPGLKLEPDVFWIRAAGYTPIEFLENNKQYICIVHLKELSKDGPSAKNPVVGQGTVEADKVIRFAAENKHPYIVLEFESVADEQKYLAESMQFIRKCM